MKEQIRVTVEKDGTVFFKVENAKGARCVSMTEAFEREIGPVIERKKTSDYYKVTGNAVQNCVTSGHAA